MCESRGTFRGICTEGDENPVVDTKKYTTKCQCFCECLVDTDNLCARDKAIARRVNGARVAKLSLNRKRECTTAETTEKQ